MRITRKQRGGLTRVAFVLVCSLFLADIIPAAPVAAQGDSVTPGTASAQAGSSTWMTAQSPFTGDANSNSYTTYEYSTGIAGPWTTACAPGIPGDSAWRVCVLNGLSAGTDYFVRVTFVDPDGVSGANPQVIGPVRTAAVADPTVTVDPATATVQDTAILVSAPIRGDANRDSSLQAVEIAASPNGPWTRKCGPHQGSFSPQLCRLQGLVHNTSYWVRVTISDPDGVNGPNPQILDPIQYTGLTNLALSRAITADSGWGCCTNPAELVDGRIQNPDWTYGFAWSGGTGGWGGGSPGWKQATIDLGSSKPVARLDWWTHDAYHLPTDWKVLVSEDNVAYTEVFATSIPSCRTAPQELYVSWWFPSCAHSARFAPVAARYVRYTFDDRTLLNGLHGWGVELEVFGPDDQIQGLIATNDGPTALGTATTLTATVAAGTSVSYLWDFGDHSSGAGAVVQHSYAAPGIYSATVTATNSQGSATASTAVQVRAAAPEIGQVVPSQGANDLPVQIDINGAHFASGITARLRRGITEVPLEELRVVDAGHLQATVPAGLAPGIYDLSVTNPDGQSGTLPNAYTVREGIDDLSPAPLGLWLDPPGIHGGSANSSMGLIIQRQGGKNTLSDVAVKFYQGDPLVSTNLVGTGIVPLFSPRSQISTGKVAWNPAPGTYTLYAVIDPADQVIESDENNNVISRTVTVLPALPDKLAPHVDSFTINNGAVATTMRQVQLNASARDNERGSGVDRILYVEFEFIQSVSAWTPVRSSNWLSYTLASTNYPWELTPTAGLHYLQAWAADRAGNISLAPYVQMIHYTPPISHVARDQIRVYRQALSAGQTLQVRLTPSSGDPDLYVWTPETSTGIEPPYVSNLSGNAVDEITLTAIRSGVYQIEVYGYTSADYSLEILPGSNGQIQHSATPGVKSGGLDPAKTVPQKPAIPVNHTPNNVGIPSAPLYIFLPLIRR
jgi:PKD repeat protein